MTADTTAQLLHLEGLTKAYPGVIANSDVSFAIKPGEIHALLGENGAGKSTLVKMIYGLVRPDQGRMTLRGAPYQPAKPSEARQSGVAMVFQHFSLFDALNVAENVALGMENPPGLGELSKRIKAVSQEYGLPLDPEKLVGDLSAGERQRVEIIRCLLQDPKLLIMDEPTSVLTPQEVDILFRTLRQLSAEGTAILYISHKLEEIRTLCDEATILRRGKVVARCNPREKSARELAELMVGQVLTPPARAARPFGDMAIEVKNLSLKSPNTFGTSLKNISLQLRHGEILGIAGVAGNGQDELLLALSGELLSPSEAILLNGKPIGRLGPNARRALGAVGLVSAPEERLGHAAAPDMSLTENALLSSQVRMGFLKHGFIHWPKVEAFAQKIITTFDVRTAGTHVAARALSGGNLQKFVIGREILQDPGVIIVNQPTWGVDAAAAAAIRQSLLELAGRGAAVIAISQDLDELLEIADSFAALNEGRLSPPRPAAGLTVEEIGLMMGGVHAPQVKNTGVHA